MPYVRLKSRPDEVLFYSDKELVDPLRWGLVLEVLADKAAEKVSEPKKVSEKNVESPRANGENNNNKEK